MKMTDKKMIEEMASVMNNVMFNYCRELDKCRDLCQYNGKSCRQYTCRDYGYAERLYKAGYRNCKDKVVLTKEEYDELLKGVKTINYTAMFDNAQAQRIIDLEMRLAQTRKETAREILELFKDEYGYIGDLESEIAEKYGTVEVEE